MFFLAIELILLPWYFKKLNQIILVFTDDRSFGVTYGFFKSPLFIYTINRFDIDITFGRK